MWITDDGGAAIKGSVTIAGREGSVEVQEFSHNVYIATDGNNGKLTGSRVHRPMTIVKQFDAASTCLYKAVTTGQMLKSVLLKWYQIDDSGKEQEYFSIQLENAKVVSVGPAMHNTKDPACDKYNHFENIALRYEKITWIYKDGNLIHADSWNEGR